MLSINQNNSCGNLSFKKVFEGNSLKNPKCNDAKKLFDQAKSGLEDISEKRHVDFYVEATCEDVNKEFHCIEINGIKSGKVGKISKIVWDNAVRRNVYINDEPENGKTLINTIIDTANEVADRVHWTKQDRKKHEEEKILRERQIVFEDNDEKSAKKNKITDKIKATANGIARKLNLTK